MTEAQQLAEIIKDIARCSYMATHLVNRIKFREQELKQLKLDISNIEKRIDMIGDEITSRLIHEGVTARIVASQISKLTKVRKTG